MNLLNSKTCKSCINALAYGSKGNMKVKCGSPNYTYQNNFHADKEFCAGWCEGYKRGELRRCGEILQVDALEFILGGQSEFVLHSTKTNEDFSYELKATDSTLAEHEGKTIFFLTITYNHERIYAGTVWFNSTTKLFEFKQGEKGKIANNNIALRSLLYVLNKLYTKDAVQYLIIYHTGKCSICGKVLKGEEEIKKGLHNECIQHHNYTKIYIDKVEKQQK